MARPSPGEPHGTHAGVIVQRERSETVLAILAGIDEAGFGPTLGPLVVAGVAFELPDAKIDACLWELLRHTCTRDVRRGGLRLTVADSKRLYRPAGGLAPLERTALVMLAAGGQRPRTWRDLLNHVAPQAEAQLASYPWYADVDPPLPVSTDVGDIPTQANAIARDCAVQGVRLVGVHAEPLAEGHFNRLVRKTRNKSSVLLSLALRVIDRITRASRARHIRVLVDRLGGRKHYRDALTTAMPGFALRILEESDERSAYELRSESRVLRIEFGTRSDDSHFPVALASVYAKYIRELYMRVFNQYWCGQESSLRPTAGYYVDARRWLADAGPVIDRLSVDRGLLVRER